MKNQCKICSNVENNRTMTVREMLFGTREEFEYFKCADCGCLQIVEIPQDMARHYPADKYYSYHSVKNTGFGSLVHKLLVSGYFAGIVPLQSRYVRNFQKVLPYLREFKVKKCAKILDVGCGDGGLIQEMGVWGWKNLTGIDPYNEKDVIFPSGVKILKQNIFDHVGKYDLIMMHHSLEHLENPLEVLQRCSELLAPKGKLLIRIPVADCYVFRKYGIDAFQIDAPRHFFLHTTKSLSIVAQKSSFFIEKISYDAGVRQFIESESYCLGISHYEEKMKISKSRMKMLKKQAKMLNAIHDGDQACFILRKKQ